MRERDRLRLRLRLLVGRRVRRRAPVPRRVALTISGHTHGGQVRLLGWAPIVPSRYGRRYVYGHIVEDGRHLVVSGGLGCSNAPLRLG